MPLVWHSSHIGAVAKHCFERAEWRMFDPSMWYLWIYFIFFCNRY